MEPRPYQEKAIRHIIEYAAENIAGKLLEVCPPGGGKTLIGAHAMRLLAAQQGLRGLFWAHRRELVGQAWTHLVECGIPKDMLGVIMAQDPRTNPNAPIQVASVDTLANREKPPADFIVSDEAHHDASDGRRKLREMYPNAFRVGLTATPERLDGRSLAGDYERMHIAALPSELLAGGWIVAPQMYTVPPSELPNLRHVGKVAGDYDIGQLDTVLNRKELVGSIVDHWQRLANRRATIVYPVGVKHSRAIVTRFQAAGVRAEHLDGDTSAARRRAIVGGLASGKIDVVSSCDVLSEGVDIPPVKCVVMARPTESLTLAIQQGGRCMRPWNGVEPLILDHAGNLLYHGPPHIDRKWDWGGGGAAGGASHGKRIPHKRCGGCGMILPIAARICETCTLSFWIPPEDIAERDVHLIEWDRITEYAQQHGFGESWARKVYAAKLVGATDANRAA